MVTKNLEKKYKRALIIGCFLFGIGIALISWGVFIWNTAPSYSFDRIGAIWLWVISVILFHFGGWYLADFTRIKKKPEEIRKPEKEVGEIRIAGERSEKEEKVSMSTEDMNKRFKSKLISGIIYFGIGITLIIIGALFQNILEIIYFSVFKLRHVLWVVSGILIIAGVGFMVHSVVLKMKMKKLERSEGMKKPEEIKKTEKEEKEESIIVERSEAK